MADCGAMPAATLAPPALPRPRRRGLARVLGGLALLLLALLGALALALWLAIDREPRILGTPPVSVQDIERVRLLLAGHDPRRALPGITRAVVLTQADLDLLLNQGGRRVLPLQGRVRLQPGLAVVEASLALPANPLGGWLNLHAVLRETRALPEVERLRIGRLPVPGLLAELALPHLLDALKLGPQGELARRMVNQVGFRSQHLVLAYAWPENARQTLADTLLSPDAQARLLAHDAQLQALLARPGPDGKPLRQVPLPGLMAEMFAWAQSRSTDASSARAENRAAITALAFAAYGSKLAPLLAQAAPSAAQAVRRRPPDLLLAGRIDLPQHLVISAALALEGGGPLADAIGLYKEVADSRHGSGFSFADLAADRAGTRLGLALQRDPRGVQARLAAGLRDADLVPDVSDMPEYMPEAEFRRRFGGVGGPMYEKALQEIDRRLDGLPLLAARR